MTGFADVCFSGTGKDSLLAAITEIDAHTVHEKIYGDEASFYAFYGRKRPDTDPHSIVYSFLKASRCRKGNGQKIKTKLVSFTFCEGSEEMEFMEKLAATGIMITRGENEYMEMIGFSPASMKEICGKAHIYEESASGNSCFRNLYVIERLLSPESTGRKKNRKKGLPANDIPSVDSLTFTIRDYGNSLGLRFIAGVTTDKFNKDKLESVLSVCCRIMSMDPTGGAEIGEWSAGGGVVTIDILFPSMKQAFSLTPETQVFLTPGIQVVDSDCGRSSWTVSSFVKTETGQKILNTKRKRHDGNFNAEKESVAWMRDIFIPDIEDYFEQVRVAAGRTFEKEEDAVSMIRTIGAEKCKKIGLKKFRIFESAALDRMKECGGYNGLAAELCLIEADAMIEEKEKAGGA
jgi:hypothetical protein